MATKIVFIVLGMFGVLGCFAQQHFYNTYGGNGYDTSSDVIQIELDSSYYMVGSSSSATEGPSQISLLHVDKFGNYLASYFYGGPNSDIGVRVLHKPGEGFWLAGYSNSFSENANFDYYLIKLNENYELQWQKTYGGPDWERLRDAILLPDDGVLLVGEVEGLNTLGKDAYVVRTDASGEIVYEQTHSGAQDDIIYSCTLFNETSYLVGGVYGSITANAWLACFDFDGNVLWSRPDYFSDRICVIRQVLLADGLIYFYGEWTPLPFISDNFRPFQARAHLNNAFIDVIYENGVKDKNIGFINMGPNLFYSAIELNNSSLVGDNGPKAAIWEFEGGGYFTSSFSHEVYGNKVKPQRIIRTLDAKIALTGTIEDPNFSSGGGNAFLLKIDETVVSLEVINQNQIVAVDEFEVAGFSMYPNPTSNTISIVLPGELQASEFSILDAQGREVMKGPYTEQVDLSLLALGTYMLQLSTNQGLKTMRILKQ